MSSQTCWYGIGTILRYSATPSDNYSMALRHTLVQVGDMIDVGTSRRNPNADQSPASMKPNQAP